MPVVALLRPAVLEACDGGRVLLLAQHVLEVVDAEVEEEVVLLAGEEVQLAVELGPSVRQLRRVYSVRS